MNDDLKDFMRRMFLEEMTYTGPDGEEIPFTSGTPPVVGGLAGLARAGTISSMAKRAPELLRWLASGKVLKVGSSRWKQLTKDLTNSQKRSVETNMKGFRDYFRRVRMPNEAVPVGPGTIGGPGVHVGPGGGPGIRISQSTQLARRPTGPMAARSTPPGPAVTSGPGQAMARGQGRAVRGTPVPDAASTGRNWLPWIIGGGLAAEGVSQYLSDDGEPSQAGPQRGGTEELPAYMQVQEPWKFGEIPQAQAGRREFGISPERAAALMHGRRQGTDEGILEEIVRSRSIPQPSSPDALTNSQRRPEDGIPDRVQMKGVLGDEPRGGGFMGAVNAATDFIAHPLVSGLAIPLAESGIRALRGGDDRQPEHMPQYNFESQPQWVKSDRPGISGSWQDLPYELQPQTTLSEREIMRMIRGSR